MLMGSPEKVRELRPPFKIDLILVSVTCALVSIGMLMVYSTTGVSAQEKFGDSFYFLRKQAAGAAIGFVLLLVAARLEISWLKEHSAWFLAAALLLLLLPFLPGIGEAAGGARRWVNLTLIRFQPAEMAKPLFAIFLAGYLARREKELHSFSQGLFVPMLLFLPLAILLLLQPDFGTTVVTALLVLCMCGATGMRLRYIGYSALALVGAAAVLVLVSPYRMARVLSFLSPFSDPSGKGYQLIQSLIAVGTGKVTGVGLGGSRQKLFFLPAAHTDFIFAVLAEELGFLGAVGLIGLFSLFLWRGLLLAGKFVQDAFCFSLVVGLVALIVVPAFLNMAVVVGLLPTKGMVLPFVAYGPSSLIASCGEVGLLLALARHARTNR